MVSPAALRVGASCAIVGGSVTLALDVLHPSDPAPDDIVRQLELIAATPTWAALHWGLGLGLLLILGAFVVLELTLRGSDGEIWARGGLAAMVVATAVWVIAFALEAALADLAADARVDPAIVPTAGAVIDVAESVVSGGILVNWLGTALFGLALWRSRRYPVWLGLPALALSLVILAAVGVPRAFVGTSRLVDNVLFPTLAALSLAWTVALGVVLWRRASRG
ncbi:MAG: hypothetical protein HY216_04255 [Candidatus Rokubacteria bacterium]|nr:hypothetical protein [Candidatus Rokubacteria bacterium]